MSHASVVSSASVPGATVPSENRRKPLAISAVEAALKPPTRERIESIDYFAETESTNRHLLHTALPPTDKARVALADYQTGGRGRQGRQWTMPFGAGIALSVAWRFASRPDDLSAFSLAAGAATRRAIGSACNVWVELKWPNDLIVAGGKLGGILIELGTQGAGCLVVAGVGINVDVPGEVLDGIEGFSQGARNLRAAAPAATVDRDRLAACLIDELVDLFAGYAATGFAPYRAEFEQAHILQNQSVKLHTTVGIQHGRVLGIASDGALLVEDANGRAERFIAGDVTVRSDVDARN